MKKQFSIKGFMSVLLISALLFCVGAAAGHELAAGIGAAAYMGSAVLKPWLHTGNMSGISISGINREIWQNHLIENIYPGNEFLLAMSDESEYVNYLTVHSPQAVGTPNVVKNRDLTVGTAVNTNTRVDVTLDWSIDEYTTDPFKITNAEEVQLSYNKRESILYNQQMKLRKVIAENIIIDLAATGTATLPADYGGGTNNNILRTSGIFNNDPANVQASVAYTAGATGNRLNVTLWDVAAAATHLDNLDVPSEGRAMLMSSQAYAQLRLDLIATKYRDFTAEVDPKTGKIGKLLGFDLYMRSKVCVYDNSGTPVVKAYGAAGAATDNDAILFWQFAHAAKAIGDVHVFETLNDATRYGDIYSALLRMGAHKVRVSEVGIGAIVQKASA